MLLRRFLPALVVLMPLVAFDPFGHFRLDGLAQQLFGSLANHLRED